MLQIDPSKIIPCGPPTSKKFRNLTGLKFGRLLVLSLAGKQIQKNGLNVFYWDVECDCGSVSKVRSQSLSGGFTASCGCLQREVALSYEGEKTHGLTGSKEYQTWSNMIQRCTNPKHSGFKNYGGRGIRVCERWKRFENFFIDMGPKPKPENQIGRRNNNLGYQPDNCVWENRNQQMRNMRRNRLVTFEGVTLCCAEWDEKMKFRPGTVSCRLHRGWSIGRALTALVVVNNVTA